MQAIKDAAAAAAKAAALRAAKSVKSREHYSPKMLKKLAPAAKIDRKILKTGKNAFDILAQFRNFGIGQTLTRKIWRKYWTDPNVCDCFWTVTRVRPRNRVRFYAL